MSEQLTAQNATTMYAARQMRAKGKLCHAWTDGCKLKVRVSEKAPARLIGNIEDLIKIVGPDSQLESLIDGAAISPAGGAPAVVRPAGGAPAVFRPAGGAPAATRPAGGAPAASSLAADASAAAQPAGGSSAVTPSADRASDGNSVGVAGGKSAEGRDAGERGESGSAGERKRVLRSDAAKK